MIPCSSLIADAVELKYWIGVIIAVGTVGLNGAGTNELAETNKAMILLTIIRNSNSIQER